MKKIISVILLLSILFTCVFSISTAAAETKLSPLFIASLIIVEQGTKGTSSLISGSYPGYEGYYNFFNVGASGQSEEDIVKSGLEYAKAHGWNSISSSILGGAKVCANGYISCGQDTYYYMDFNVVLGDYNHQYATAIYDAYNKGRRISNSCKNNKNAIFEFVIPVFTPENSESPNAGVTIANTKMYSNAGTDNTHTLPGETTNYIMDVPANSEFAVLGSKFDGDGDKWYFVNYNGTTGYLYSGKVRVSASRHYSDNFETNLSYFPTEYHDALRNLHNEYPNWRFIAEPTGCTLSQAVENEYRSGNNSRPRKLVELTYMGEEWRDERAKLPDGTYENAEGNRWTYASRMAISYFINPLNFLNSDDIFMFLQLSDNDGKHTRDMLVSVVEGTFLNKDVYLDAIMRASANLVEESPVVNIIKRGDINRDNVIDVIDAAMIRKHILGIALLDVSANPEADINKDGVIDVIDAAKIRKDILNIEKIGG